MQKVLLKNESLWMRMFGEIIICMYTVYTLVSRRGTTYRGGLLMYKSALCT